MNAGPTKIKVYTENNDYQHAEVLKRNRVKRSKNNQFFVEGVKSIDQLVKNYWEIDAFLYSNDDEKTNWAKNLLEKSTAKKHFILEKHLLEKLSDKEETSEIIALATMKKNDLSRIKIKNDLLIVVLDRPSNPGNLGTIIRSCESFGVDAILITGHSVDMYDPKTIQASIGTIFSIPIIRLEKQNDLITWIKQIKSKLKNFKVLGTSAKTDACIDKESLVKPLMILIGNETTGLSYNYKNDVCDKLLKIPIFGSASSLNVACATSIFLYEISKQNNLAK